MIRYKPEKQFLIVLEKNIFKKTVNLTSQWYIEHSWKAVKIIKRRLYIFYGRNSARLEPTIEYYITPEVECAGKDLDKVINIYR